MMCSHQGVARIVPLTTEDDSGSRLRKKLPEASCDSLARDLHESLRSLTRLKGSLLC